MNVCKREVTGSTPLRSYCTGCGHQSALHPGIPNPGLAACVGCLVMHLAYPDVLAAAEENSFGASSSEDDWSLAL